VCTTGSAEQEQEPEQEQEGSAEGSSDFAPGQWCPVLLPLLLPALSVGASFRASFHKIAEVATRPTMGPSLNRRLPTVRHCVIPIPKESEVAEMFLCVYSIILSVCTRHVAEKLNVIFCVQTTFLSIVTLWNWNDAMTHCRYTIFRNK